MKDKLVITLAPVIPDPLILVDHQRLNTEHLETSSGRETGLASAYKV